MWPCVQDKELLLPVHNPSQIPADFKTFIEGRDSPFAVVPREGHLEPNESMPLKAGLPLLPSCLPSIHCVCCGPSILLRAAPGLLSGPPERQGLNLGSAMCLKLQDGTL